MLSRRVSWSVVVIATLTMTVSYVDRQTLSVIGPTVSKALDLTETQFGLLGSAFALAYLIGTPLAGWWLDRTGARRGLATSVLVWSVVAALHALVPNFAVMVAMRIALGLAEGPGFPGAAQTVQRMLPPESRSRGFGLLFTGSSIGAMIAAPLAARIAAAFGWRWAFLGTALVALLWLPVWIVLTRREDVRAQLDVAPASSAGQEVRPRLAALLAEPAMIRGLIGVLAAAPVLGFAMTWGAKYLARTFQLDQKHVGDYLWVPPLCLDLGAILFGDLAARTRRRASSQTVLYALAMVLAAALVGLPYATTPWESMIVFGVACAGGGGLYTLCTSELLSRMTPSAVAFAGGVLAGAQSLALIVANPLIGGAVDRYHDYVTVAVVLGAWVVPGSLIWIAWRPRRLGGLGLQA